MSGNAGTLSTEPQASIEVEVPPSKEEKPLRQRKKSVRRLSYVVSNENEATDEHSKKSTRLTDAQESVFLNMYIRKMHRRIRGTQNNDSLCCEFVVVVILFFVIVMLGWDDTPDDEDGEMTETDTVGLVILLLWIIFALVMFFVFSESPYSKMMRYMIVYIPLLFFVASLAFWEEVREEGSAFTQHLLPQQHVFFALAVIAEAFTFIGFMFYYKVFPKIVESKWILKKPGRVRWFWNVEAIVENDEWTMSYRGHNPGGVQHCQLNYTCKYEGDIDPSTGLPDGLGRWLDDAWEGEMLTGYWKQGKPVAPFSSWNVGSDDAVVAVRVAYFKATDDLWNKNKLFPTNDQNPPECGVASVECSVSGSFYKHLPSVNLIEGPYIADSIVTKSTNLENNPIREVLSHLIQVGEASEDGDLNIRATDPRGIQVLGHVYQPTGRFYAPDAKNITIDVEWGVPGEEVEANASDVQSPGLIKLPKRTSARVLQRTLFMAKAAPSSHKPFSKLVEVEFDESSYEDLSDNEEAGNNNLEEVERQNSQTTRTATLHVRDWVPNVYKEALIFFPGYNSSMEASLKNLGQFLAMTKLNGHVYPFVFAWPGSFNLGYPFASKISATDINAQNVLKLVRGLKEAGITRVHMLTHSMGVQTLMGAFRDRYDENGKCIGRSEVSKCFALDPEFDDTEGPKEGMRQQYSNQMVCKSITLLNPDFPVQAFVDRGFLSIRRVCQTITVVGDRNDRALGFSSFINGVAPKFGYKQPEVLEPAAIPSKPKWEFMERIGRSIEELYLPAEVAQQYRENGRGDEFRRQLFNKAASNHPIGQTKDVNNNENLFWLDIDVIDMTGLDTNIKGMRHSGFSLNGMLLKDLQELFTTGKRAMKRSTLIFREGNQFSFAHAPAFVQQ